jgi:hypothetical protein
MKRIKKENVKSILTEVEFWYNTHGQRRPEND